MKTFKIKTFEEFTTNRTYFLAAETRDEAAKMFVKARDAQNHHHWLAETSEKKYRETVQAVIEIDKNDSRIKKKCKTNKRRPRSITGPR